MKKQKFTIIALIVVILLVVFISSGNKETPSNYLGFQEKEVNIKNNKEMGEVMFSFVDGLGKLNEADIKLYQSSINKDVESFFNDYRSFNEIAGKLISQARALALFEEMGQGEIGFNLISPAFAKKRSSFWYYVPIVGSLVKAKHKSIETSRAGVYHYVKDKLDSVDRKAKLQEYGFNDVEELRNASDEDVERIARDPELRSGIDWTKVTTDLGDTAVKTVVEANNAVLGGEFNPVKGTIDNVKKDIINDGKMQSMTLEDQMGNKEDKRNSVGRVVLKSQDQKKQTKRVTLGIRGSAKEMLESRAGNVLEKKWSDWSAKKQEKISNDVIDYGKNKSLVAAHKSSDNQKHEINVHSGTWDFKSVAFGGAPINLDGVNVKAGEIKEIIRPSTKDDISQGEEKNNEIKNQNNKKENNNQNQNESDNIEKESQNQKEENQEQENNEVKNEDKKNQQEKDNKKDNFTSIEPRGEQVKTQGNFNMQGVQGPVNITLFPEGGPLSGTIITPLGKANFNGGANYNGKAYADVSGTFEHPDPETGIMISCSLDGEMNGQIQGNVLTGNFESSCATDNYNGTWTISW